MQTICFTLPQPRIHACMRLSFDSRFVVTESCGKLPLWMAMCEGRPSHGNILRDTSRARPRA